MIIARTFAHGLEKIEECDTTVVGMLDDFVEEKDFALINETLRSIEFTKSGLWYDVTMHRVNDSDELGKTTSFDVTTVIDVTDKAAFFYS